MSDALASGAQLFARYAYPPNTLGYCGPADAAALLELAATGHTDADIVAVAHRFTGAWQYLTVLAELAEAASPLAEEVVRAYWTGGRLLDEVDRTVFGARLLQRVGAGAGHYWTHLDTNLLAEAMPTHGFHVFGVYPWTRLLAAGPADVPLQVLDSCRIRWAQIVAVDGPHAVVRASHLTWDQWQLGLGPEREERVRLTADGHALVADPQPGQWLALHWDCVCDVLTPAELACLRRWTDWQLGATNVRLTREAGPGSCGVPELGRLS